MLSSFMVWFFTPWMFNNDVYQRTKHCFWNFSQGLIRTPCDEKYEYCSVDDCSYDEMHVTKIIHTIPRGWREPITSHNTWCALEHKSTGRIYLDPDDNCLIKYDNFSVTYEPPSVGNFQYNDSYQVINNCDYSCIAESGLSYVLPFMMKPPSGKCIKGKAKIPPKDIIQHDNLPMLCSHYDSKEPFLVVIKDAIGNNIKLAEMMHRPILRISECRFGYVTVERTLIMVAIDVSHDPSSFTYTNKTTISDMFRCGEHMLFDTQPCSDIEIPGNRVKVRYPIVMQQGNELINLGEPKIAEIGSYKDCPCYDGVTQNCYLRYSDWTDCTKKCGPEKQIRVAVCFVDNMILKNCHPRQPLYKSCNHPTCDCPIECFILSNKDCICNYTSIVSSSLQSVTIVVAIPLDTIFASKALAINLLILLIVFIIFAKIPYIDPLLPIDRLAMVGLVDQ